MRVRFIQGNQPNENPPGWAYHRGIGGFYKLAEARTRQEQLNPTAQLQPVAVCDLCLREEAMNSCGPREFCNTPGCYRHALSNGEACPDLVGRLIPDEAPRWCSNCGEVDGWECPGCGEDFCSGCVVTCAECKESSCAGCLTYRESDDSLVHEACREVASGG